MLEFFEALTKIVAYYSRS